MDVKETEQANDKIKQSVFRDIYQNTKDYYFKTTNIWCIISLFSYAERRVYMYYDAS